MEKQPRLSIQPAKVDRILDAVSWAVLSVMWGIGLWGTFTLPETIPVHFNFRGQPDGYGSPLFILGLPVLTTLMVAGMTWLNRYPHIFNYPVKITPENALRQYTNATRLIRLMKLTVAVLFLGISLMIILSAGGIIEGPGIWFVPAILLIVYLPLAVYIRRSFRMK